MKRVIGVTGGIASGKSNVCNVIKEAGYPVLDCDKITQELSDINMPIYNAIVNAFGQEFLLEDKKLDKKKISKLIFNNDAAKLRLNQVTHPIIREELIKRIGEIQDGLVFVEVPLLFEAKFNDICDKVICVFLTKKRQVERLMDREGIDEDYALAKIHSQMDLYLKREMSDYVVDSKGDFDETKKQVINIIDLIKEGV